MVLTKDSISFAFVEHNEEIDQIPLSGIDYVKLNEELLGAVDADLDSSHDYFCLQVATDPQGHNSGRSYYMRTSSKAVYDDFSLVLGRLAKAARKRAQASTIIQKAQLRVRKVYGRFICQSIFALIILGVNSMKS